MIIKEEYFSMAIHESIAPDLYAEIDAQGPLIEEGTYGPLAEWPQDVFRRVYSEHLDPNKAIWEETTVSRLLAERWDRAYEPEAGTQVNDQFHIDLCRVMVRAREEGRFNIEILDRPEQTDYLSKALSTLANLDPSDPVAYDIVLRRELGPFVRQVGRDIAQLHLAGESGKKQVAALQSRLVREATSEVAYPAPVRGVLFALIEASGGYVEAT